MSRRKWQKINITFQHQLKKKHDNGKTATYGLKFIDSFRFISTSLSKLVDNLSERLHKDKGKDCKSKLSYLSVEDNQLIFQFLACKKNYEKELNMELNKTFLITYQFSNGDLNKFVLLLRKGLHPYEYMGSWERFDKTSLPDKEAFYSRLSERTIWTKYEQYRLCACSRSMESI